MSGLHSAIAPFPTPVPAGLARVASARVYGHGFGSFRLLPAQRLLLEGEQPVALGSRAFDLLVALVTHAGQVLTKQQLLAAAWPGRIVEDNTLRVHIAALRRTLKRARCGADGDGDCIVNVPGRGYCLVAPVWPLGEAECLEAMAGHAGLAGRRPAEAPRPAITSEPVPAPSAPGDTVEAMQEALRQQFEQAFARGEHDLMLKAGEQLAALARDTGPATAIGRADQLRVQAYHFMGRQREAAALMRHLPAEAPLALDIVRVRQHWLEGRPAQAQAEMTALLARAEQAPAAAHCEALTLGALPLAFWRGDTMQAGRLLARLAELCREPGCGRHYRPWVESLDLLLDRSPDGFARLSRLLERLGAEQAKLADHLVSFDARLVSEATLQRVLKCQTGWCAPEVLRARAEQLARARQPRRALRLLDDSLSLARAQGSLAWELRSALSRAHLRAPASLAALTAIVRRLGDGDGGAEADLRAARRLLEGQTPDRPDR